MGLAYFKFYPGDWLRSPATRRMTHEERGVYIDLLAYAWDEGGIPADHETLARQVQLTPRRFSRIWPALKPCWTKRGNRYVNSRMERERAEIEEAHRRRVDAGRKGGLSR